VRRLSRKHAFLAHAKVGDLAMALSIEQNVVQFEVSAQFNITYFSKISTKQ